MSRIDFLAPWKSRRRQRARRESQQRFFKPLVERLEARRVLSVSAAITGSAPDRVLQIDGDAGDQDLLLRLDGGQTNLEVLEHGTGVGTFALADFDRTDIQAVGGDDTLTIELANGSLIAGGLTYDGGAGGFDSLVLNGTANSTAYTFTGPQDGQILVDGSPLDFVGLEPVIDNIPAASIVINGTDDANVFSYAEGPNSGTGFFGGVPSALVTVDGFETIEFANKQEVILNGLEGDDTFNITPDPDLPFNLTIDGGNPTSAPGDTLNYLGAGVNNVTGAGQGTITGAGVQDVDYFDIENVHIVEVDVIQETGAKLTLVGGPIGPNPQGFRLSGDSTATVSFEGKEGGADDDDGNNREEVETELVSLNLSGGGISVSLNPNQPSLGQIEELINNTPGLLDLDPFAPGEADSFFDVFFQVDVGGGLVLHNPQAMRIQTVIDEKPPLGARYIHILPPTGPIELLDQSNTPSGIFLVDAEHDTGFVEEDRFESTRAVLNLGHPDGSSERVTLTGPTTVDVFFEGNEGEADDDNGNNLDEVDTELVELNLTGNSSLGPVVLRLNPNLPSLGFIEETADSTTGTLDLPPFAATGTANSGFDVFFELEVGGQVLHTEVPKEMRALINNKPPGAGTVYQSGELVIPLLDAAGNPTGFTLGAASHVTDVRFVEVDPLVNTTASILLVGGPLGAVPVEHRLTGPALAEVLFEGANEGDAFDNGSVAGLDEVTTELVSLDLTNADGFRLTLNPNRFSFGQIEELVNNNPGRLDLDPFHPGDATSHFDVNFQIEVPGGQVLHNNDPLRIETIIRNKPPFDRYRHVVPVGGPIELFDANDNPTGVFLIDAEHYPGEIEVDQFDFSLAEIELIPPTGPSERIILSGPATVDVFFEGAEGDALDDDGDNLEEVDTEIVSMSLTGNSSLGPVEVRLNPNLPSLGEIEEQVNNTPGLLDVDPFAPGNADSFFDVFFEIEIGGQVFHTDVPKHMRTVITEKPPVGGVYEDRQIIPLLDAAGNPTGFSIGTTRHQPTPGTGSIHGIKFEDVDGDGVYDPFIDKRFSDVKIGLFGDADGDGVPELKLTHTNQDGEYWFEDLFPGPFTVIESPPDHTVPTTPTFTEVFVGLGQELVAMPGQAMNLEPGQTEVVLGSQLMFGNTILGSIHGFKFEDVDADGVYDPAIDRPMSGVQIALYGDPDNDGDPNLLSVDTDENGEYWFTKLWPGPYTIAEDPPAGSKPTTPTSTSVFVFSGEELVALPGQAMLGPGQEEVVLGAQLMFGNALLGSIHGYKFEDLNVDGQDTQIVQTETIVLRSGQDSSGNPLNVPGTLDGSITYFTDGNSGPLTLDFDAAELGSSAAAVIPNSAWLPSLSADPDARWINWSHSPIGNGSGRPPASVLYAQPFVVNTDHIASATLDLSWAVDDELGDTNTMGVFVNQTPLNIGGGGFGSETTVLDEPITVMPGLNWLYVYQQDVSAAVSGVIYSATIDVTPRSDPRLEGYTIELSGDDGSSQTTTTMADGAYWFEDLMAGVTYTVTEVTDNVVIQVPSAGAAAITDGETFTIDVAGSGSGPVTFEFDFDGNLSDPGALLAAVTGGLTADEVAQVIVNAIIGTSSVPLPALPLGGGQVLVGPATTTTVDTSGSSLTQFVLQAKQTTPDPDPIFLLSGVEWVANDEQAAELIAAGLDPARIVIDPDLAFGNAFPGSIHGLKFDDENANGLPDPGEALLFGVDILINGDDGFSDSMVTDPGGRYWFEDLMAGVTYTVTEIPPTGTTQTTPDPAPRYIGSGMEWVATRQDKQLLIDAGIDPMRIGIDPHLAFGNAGRIIEVDVFPDTVAQLLLELPPQPGVVAPNPLFPPVDVGAVYRTKGETTLGDVVVMRQLDSAFTSEGEEVTFEVSTHTTANNNGAGSIALTGETTILLRGRTGNETGSWETEMVSLSLSGSTAGGPTVEVRLDANRAALGQTTISDQGDGTFLIDSFFDVFTELSVDGGQIFVPEPDSTRFELVQAGIITPQPDLPPTDGVYRTAGQIHAEFQGPDLEIILQDIRHRPFADPRPQTGIVGNDEEEFFQSSLTGTAIVTGFGLDAAAIPVELSGPVLTIVRDKAETTTGTFQTEILSMNLSGDLQLPDGSILPVAIREAPSQDSTGQVTITDLGNGQFNIDSFFDVFTELSVDGGDSWIAAADGTRVQLAPPPQLITLTGPATVHVFFEGPNEGDASDDDGNLLDEVETEIVSLQLSGSTPLGPVEATLRSDVRSTGQIEEQVDVTTGVLDVDPFTQNTVADSFFDVWTEITVGGRVLHTNGPLRLETPINHKPPQDGERYQNPFLVRVELIDPATGQGTGIFVLREIHQPDPTTEIDVFEDTTATINLIDLASGAEEKVDLRGPATVHVFFEGPSEGDAVDDDGDGLEEVQTEIVSLNLTGSSSLGQVHVRQRSDVASLGQIRELANNTAGLLDIDPFAPGDAASYFDVFFEIEVGGQTFITAQPKRMRTIITEKPPGPGDTYVDRQIIPLLDPTDLTPTGLALGAATHTPNPGIVEVDEFPETVAQLLLELPSEPGIVTSNPNLPPTDGVYRTAGQIHAEFQGADLEIILQDIRHRAFADPRPQISVQGRDEIESFQSSLVGTAVITSASLGLDAVPVPVELTGPVQTTVLGKAGRTTGTFQTEIVSMSLSGSVALPGGGTIQLAIREHPIMPSTGQVNIIELGGGAGGGDSDQGGGNFRIDSFFDVFTELSVDGGQTFIPSTSSTRVELAPPPQLVTLTGPATVHVFFEGRNEGDARDDDGNNRDEVQTEIVALQLSGNTPLGPIEATLRDDRPSRGQIEEQVNVTPGVLDVDPFTNNTVADSFFDVWTEITIGGRVLQTAQPLNLVTPINHKPPQDGERYVNPFQVRVELIDALTGEGTGIFVLREIHQPDPTTEVDVFTDTFSTFTLVNLLTGAEEKIDLRGPSTVHVYFEGPNEGDAVDDDGDGLEEVAAEIISVDLTGNSSLGPVHARQRTDVASLGLVTELANNTSGLLDVDPFAPGDAHSFFDVFFEVEVGGRTYITAQPKRLQTIITEKPPGPGDTYADNTLTPLLDAVTLEPTGLAVSTVLTTSRPPIEVDVFPNTVAQLLLELPPQPGAITASPTFPTPAVFRAASGTEVIYAAAGVIDDTSWDLVFDDSDNVSGDEVTTSQVTAHVSFRDLAGLGPVTVHLEGQLETILRDRQPNALGNFLAEIVSMELTGDVPGGPTIVLRKDANQLSPGQTSFAAEGGQFSIDSFFDVFTELSVDGGQSFVAASNSMRLELVQAGIVTATPNLPPTDGVYRTAGQIHAEFQGPDLEIILQDIRHRAFADPRPQISITAENGNEHESFQSSLTGTAIVTSASLGLDAVPIPVELSGPVQTIVRGKGENRTGSWDTEILSMSLSGDVSLPGGGRLSLTIQESPTQASSGEVTVTDLRNGQFHIDSFFDVFTELSVDGGQNFIPATASTRVELAPPPQLVSLVGPATVHVFFEGHDEGDARDNDGNNLDEVQTEIVSLQLAGTSPFGPVEATLRGDVRSLGQIEEQANLTRGVLDVDPFTRNAVADSFFDVWTEITVGGRVLQTAQPLRLQTSINHKPPQDGESYVNPFLVRVELIDPLTGRGTGIYVLREIHQPDPTTEVDFIESTTALVQLQGGPLGAAPVPFILSGSSEVHVYFEGPNEGDARDDSGNNLDEVVTELISLNLSDGNVTLRVRDITQSPFSPSLGQIEEKANNNPGSLDLDPFHAGQADSFFDVLFEIELPDGTILHNGKPLRIEAVISEKPPFRRYIHIIPPGGAIELLDENNDPSGIFITRAEHRTGKTEIDVLENTQALVQIEDPAGNITTHILTGDAEAHVFFEGPNEGDAKDDDGDGLDEVDTELFRLNLTDGNVTLLENPFRPSFGGMTEQTNAQPGTLDVAPFGNGAVDSFFDVFFKLDVGGLLLHNEDALTLEATIFEKPPFRNYVHLIPPGGGIDLFDEAGDPTGFKIVRAEHRTGKVEVDVLENTQALVQIANNAAGAGAQAFILDGSAVAHVLFEGPNEGDAKDDDGDGLDEVQTELVSLSLTHPSGLHLTENPRRPSLGGMTEQTNAQSGILDVDPFGNGVVDSFFDVFFELNVPGVGLLHNDQALTIQAEIHEKPPFRRYIHIIPSGGAIELLDANNNPSGVFIVRAEHRTGNTEIDVLQNTQALVQIEDPAGNVSTHILTGDAEAHVFFEGPNEGDAKDDDGDGLDEVDTELFRLNLTDGNVTLLENPLRPSFGGMTEQNNAQPGTLDVAPFGNGAVDSFFDVFFRLDVGGLLLHNEQALTLEATIFEKPPFRRYVHIIPPGGGLDLFDEAGDPTGFKIVRAEHRTGIVEIDHFEETFASLGLIDLASGAEEQIDLTGPATVHVLFEGPNEGDATDNDGDGLDEVETEIVSMNLTGTSSLGPVQVRVRTDRPSLGEIEEQVNNNSGLLDLDPFAPGNADSFFDVFFEIEVNGQRFITAQPKRMSTVITEKPPGPGDSYFDPDVIELLDADTLQPTGLAIGSARHTPRPVVEIDKLEETTGLVQLVGGPLGNVPVPFILRGSSEVHVFFEGHNEGDARDDDGNGLDEVDTELVSLDLTDGNITLSVDPNQASLGQIEELLNSTSGLLDLAPFVQDDRNQGADSFFDVFFQIDVGGGLVLHNNQALRIQAVITEKPPIARYFHIIPPNGGIELFDESDDPSGVFIVKAEHYTGFVERDEIEETTGLVQLVGGPLGSAPVPFILRGSSTVDVFFEGREGDADDDDSNGREEVQTELVSLDLTDGNITLSLNPGQASLGQIEELLNNTAGLLDLDPFANGDADSFFDVFFQIDVGGGLVVHNGSPLRIEAVISEKPPIARYFHIIPPTGAIELLDANDDPSGVFIVKAEHFTGHVEVDEFGASLAEIELIDPQGGVEVVRLNGPTTVHVFFEGAEGVAHDDDGDGLGEVQTEMVSLSLRGTSSLGPVEVRLNPRIPSRGEIEELVNNTPGLLDLDPFASGDADSFFDVFFEIQIGDQVFFTNQPKRMSTVIREKPPGKDEAYENVETIPLLTGRDEPTGFAIGATRHVPDPGNQPPVANDDAYSVSRGGTLLVAAPGVLANDTDPDGDDIFVNTVVSAPAHAASFAINSDGSFAYVHDGSAVLTDTFVYTIDDGDPTRAGNTATVTIDIHAVEVDQFSNTVAQLLLELPPEPGVVTLRPDVPPTDGVYRTAADVHAEYQGADLLIVLQDIRHRAFASPEPQITIVGNDEQESFQSSLTGTAIITSASLGLDGVAVPVDLTGPVQTLVRDKANATTGAFLTEIVSMELSGDVTVGGLGGNIFIPIIIQVSPSVSSEGQVEITDLGDGQFQIDSFFDVFTEISVDGGQNFIPSTDSTRVELVQPGIRTSKPDLPPTDGVYRTAAEIHAEFQGPDLEIILQDIRHRAFADPRPTISITPEDGNEHESFQSSLTGTAIVTSASLGLDGVPVSIELQGPVQTIVRGKGEDRTGSWDTEILSMSLSGDVSLPGGGSLSLTIQESPSQASQGHVSITDLGNGQFNIDSFFDVFTELSVDGGENFIPATGSTRVELAPAPQLVSLTGPATVHVFFEGVNEGDAHDNNNDGLDEVRTEIVSLQLSGTTPLGPVEATLRGDRRSLGEIEEQVQVAAGTLDVNPFTQNAVADSFFDVWTEITVGGRVLHTSSPLRLETEISNKPPNSGERYVNPFLVRVELIDPVTGNGTGIFVLREIHQPEPTTEVDFIEPTTALIQLQGGPVGANPVPFVLRGSSEVHVFFEGANEGDASDDSGNGLDEVATELVALNLTDGNVTLRIRDIANSPFGPSLGEIEEQVNDNPGRLDLNPFHAGQADSFFDVLFEIELADGTILHNNQPLRIQAVISDKPPIARYIHLLPPDGGIQLFDENDAPTDVRIVKAEHYTGFVEVDHSPQSAAVIQLLDESGRSVPLQLSGPATVHVFFEREEGDALDDDGNGLDEVQTELVELSLTGQSPLGAVEVRLNPRQSSRGEIEEREDNNTGRLDLDPFHPGDAASFFDVFVEVKIGGETYFTAEPKRMRGAITSKPPGAEDLYFSTGSTPLLDANGNPSGFSLGVALHSFAGQPISWHNPERDEDVNADGHVSSIDALQLINELNDRLFISPTGQLPDTGDVDEFPFIFYDVNDDRFLTAIDALQVINEVNETMHGANLEGPAILSAGNPASGILSSLPLNVASDPYQADGPHGLNIAGSSQANPLLPSSSELVQQVPADAQRVAVGPHRSEATDAALASFDLLDAPLDDLVSELDDLNSDPGLDTLDRALEAVLGEDAP